MVAPNRGVKTAIGKVKSWQSDAWDHYDNVGELRFGISWLSNALSRVNLSAAVPPLVAGSEPTLINLGDEGLSASHKRAIELVSMIADGPAGQGQMLGSCATHLSVAGICWVTIEPPLLEPDSDVFTVWCVYGTEEIRQSPNGDGIEIRVSEQVWRPVHRNGIVIKIWKKHPRRSWEPDAPTRGVLSVLREIELLTQHTQASATSRLAGAGILAIPSEAVFPSGQRPQSSEGVDPDDENTTAPEDEFIEVLIEAMTAPLSDRGSAASVVPLVIKVPGEFVDKIKHTTFSTPFDARTTELLDKAIMRLALGLDLPPDILMGTSGMNHWGAWQVAEEALTLHVEPLAETIVHGLTIGFLRIVMEAEGLDPGAVMVWFDTSDLRTRPDRSKSALEAWDRHELSNEALLRELGLSADDIPEDKEKQDRVLLEIAMKFPSLTSSLLLKLGYITEPLVADVNAGTNSPSDGIPPPPKKKNDTKGPPTQNSLDSTLALGLAEACHMTVRRALERSGSRLKSAVGKKVTGGPATIVWSDPSTLHTEYMASDYAKLDDLLEGAWSHLPEIAVRYDTDPTVLTATLDAYTRGLLATKTEHRYGRLAVALGST